MAGVARKGCGAEVSFDLTLEWFLLILVYFSKFTDTYTSFPSFV